MRGEAATLLHSAVSQADVGRHRGVALHSVLRSKPKANPETLSRPQAPSIPISKNPSLFLHPRYAPLLFHVASHSLGPSCSPSEVPPHLPSLLLCLSGVAVQRLEGHGVPPSREHSSSATHTLHGREEFQEQCKVKLNAAKGRKEKKSLFKERVRGENDFKK